MLRFVVPAVLGLLLISCGSTAHGPHATVMMKDGTSVAGFVVESSPAQLKIAGDDNVARTIPMEQVRTVTYDDAPAATATTSAPGVAAPPPASTADAAAAANEAAHDQHYHPPAAAVTTTTYVVPAGTQIRVRNEETIDSARAVEGQTFAAEVAQDVRDESGGIVVPRGANAQIIIRSAAKGGHFRGASDLVMDLDSVSVDGRRYHLNTVDLAAKGHDGIGANKRTAEFAGGGAAVGAIIGAIAGHGKGAAIGAGSGAGAGALTEILTKGGSIKVPAESLLTFRLETALRVVEGQ